MGSWGISTVTLVPDVVAEAPYAEVLALCPKLARPYWVQWVKSGTYRQSAEVLASIQADTPAERKARKKAARLAHTRSQRLIRGLSGGRIRNRALVA